MKRKSRNKIKKNKSKANKKINPYIQSLKDIVLNFSFYGIVFVFNGLLIYFLDTDISYIFSMPLFVILKTCKIDKILLDLYKNHISLHFQCVIFIWCTCFLFILIYKFSVNWKRIFGIDVSKNVNV